MGVPLYPAPFTRQSGALRWWAFDVRTIMCCTSLQVSKGLNVQEKETTCSRHPIAQIDLNMSCMYGCCYWRAAYLASKVRAMTPAATEAAREVPDWAVLQLCCGPTVTYGRNNIYFFLYSPTINMFLHRTALFCGLCMTVCVFFRIKSFWKAFKWLARIN